MEQTASTRQIQIVDFRIGDEEYGLPIETVQEIVRMPDITSLPLTEPWMKGVINLRGVVIPVIDLRAKFGLPHDRAYTARTRIVVVRHESRLAGLVVDTVSQVLDIPAETVTPPDGIVEGPALETIEGVARHGDTLVILLKPEKLLEHGTPPTQGDTP